MKLEEFSQEEGGQTPPMAGFPDTRVEKQVYQGESGDETYYSVTIDGETIVFRDERDNLSHEEAEREAQLIMASHKTGTHLDENSGTEKTVGAGPTLEGSSRVGGLGEKLMAAIKMAKSERNPVYDGLNPTSVRETIKDLKTLGVIKDESKEVAPVEKPKAVQPQGNFGALQQEFQVLIRKGRAKRTDAENTRIREISNLLRNLFRNSPATWKPREANGPADGGNKKGPDTRPRERRQRGADGGAVKSKDADSLLRGEISVLRNLEKTLGAENDSTKKADLNKKIEIQKIRVNGLSGKKGPGNPRTRFKS